MCGWKACAFVLFAACASHATTNANNPSFMIVSGISATSEMCLTAANGDVEAEGADVVLEPCAAALAAGDGRELWQRLPNGRISNAVGEKCIGADGDKVILTVCNDANTWETQGNGQFKFGPAEQSCLSQMGSTPGLEDVAAHGAISASSSADAIAHGANMAVDGSSSTFWASAMDPSGPVSVTLDVGDRKKLSAVDIQWEFPAKSFTISVSTDGKKWSQVYATDSNVISSTNIALASISASKVRVIMQKAAGAFQGHALYGIKALALHTPRLQSIVEDCSTAALTPDARDKYFETYVGEFTPCSSKALRSELLALEAARASVASVVAQLLDTLPKMRSCHATGSFLKNEGFSHTPVVLVTRSVNGNGHSRTAGLQMSRHVDSKNGINAEAVRALLEEARRIIIVTRGALF